MRSISHSLRNHTSYDRHLWYTSVSFFFVVRRVKGQKMAQNVNKLCPSCLYISETIETIGMIFISSTPVQKDNIPRFFYFFSKFFFGLNSGVKGQKMAPNNKNLCLSHSLSQEACIIWSLFLVPVCKMISLPEAFFIFSKFLFSRLLEVKRARNSPK